MKTTVEGQTVWTFTEPTLEQITSGDYTLPVNFKVVDYDTSTYKLISFVADSENGARRLELGGGDIDMRFIPLGGTDGEDIVTGDIYMNGNASLSYFNNNKRSYFQPNEAGAELSFEKDAENGSIKSLIRPSYIIDEESGIEYPSVLVYGTRNSQNGQTGEVGLVGYEDYSTSLPNNKLVYAQRAYVDSKLSELSSSNSIPDFNEEKIYQQNDVVYYEYEGIKGIYRSKINNNITFTEENSPSFQKEDLPEARLVTGSFNGNDIIIEDALSQGECVKMTFTNPPYSEIYILSIDKDYEAGTYQVQYTDEIIKPYLRFISIFEFSESWLQTSCITFLNPPFNMLFLKGNNYYKLISCPYIPFASGGFNPLNWELIADVSEGINFAGNFIPDFDETKIYAKDELFAYFGPYFPKGIYRSDIDNNGTILSSWQEVSAPYRVISGKYIDGDFILNEAMNAGDNAYLLDVDIDGNYTGFGIVCVNLYNNYQAGDTIYFIDGASDFSHNIRPISYFLNIPDSCSDFTSNESGFTVDTSSGVVYKLISCPITNSLNSVSSVTNSTLLATIVSGDFIPLTGTEEGKPITGPIQFGIPSHMTPLPDIYARSEDYNSISGIKFGEGVVSTFGSNNGGSVSNLSINGLLIYGVSLNPGNPYLGIYSTDDYSEVEPENKLIYTQRSYVDKANSYSTREEIKTGGYYEWYEEGVGYVKKPIYRKVVTTNINNENSPEIRMEVTGINIERCIGLKSIVILLIDGETHNTQYTADINEWYRNADGEEWIFITNLSKPLMMGLYEIIIEYTKTTDPYEITVGDTNL